VNKFGKKFGAKHPGDPNIPDNPYGLFWQDGEDYLYFTDFAAASTFAKKIARHCERAPCLKREDAGRWQLNWAWRDDADCKEFHESSNRWDKKWRLEFNEFLERQVSEGADPTHVRAMYGDFESLNDA